MIRILIAVPTFENISPETFKSIYNLDKTQNMIVDFDFVKGYDCARARNMIANRAVKEGYHYVLMIDSDIIIPTYTLIKMLKDPSPVCLGCYPRKNTKNGTFEIFKAGQKDYVDTFNYKELTRMSGKIEVKGGGCGCALIDVDVFKNLALSYPYFKYVEYNNKSRLSEDCYFCSNVRKAGYKIYAETDVLCGHSVKGFQWQ